MSDFPQTLGSTTAGIVAPTVEEMDIVKTARFYVQTETLKPCPGFVPNSSCARFSLNDFVSRICVRGLPPGVEMLLKINGEKVGVSECGEFAFRKNHENAWTWKFYAPMTESEERFEKDFGLEILSNSIYMNRIDNAAVNFVRVSDGVLVPVAASELTSPIVCEAYTFTFKK